MVPVFEQMPQYDSNFEEELQLNRYRLMLEKKGIAIGRMQLQVTVRDGGLAVAISRGVTRNTYRIQIRELDNEQVKKYFRFKEVNLLRALSESGWNEPCNERESWEGRRCQNYCEVAVHCPKGILYQRQPIELGDGLP